jgi:hypothetical protein
VLESKDQSKQIKAQILQKLPKRTKDVRKQKMLEVCAMSEKKKSSSQLRTLTDKPMSQEPYTKESLHPASPHMGSRSFSSGG